MVDLFEKGISFEGSLIVGAVIELLPFVSSGNKRFIKRLQFIQKQTKYGLDSDRDIRVYQLGFSDRHIAADISKELSPLTLNTRNALLEKEQEVMVVLSKYPAFYEEVFFKVKHQAL